MSLSVSTAGKKQLGIHEGNRNRVYLDTVGVPTVCRGTTEGLTRADVGRYLTDAQCARRNRAALTLAESAVRQYVTVPLSQKQFDSLVSFTYNVGVAAFRRSTLLRKLNKGDYNGAGAEMLRWRFAGGKEVRGLYIRRQQEAEPFLGHK